MVRQKAIAFFRSHFASLVCSHSLSLFLRVFVCLETDLFHGIFLTIFFIHIHFFPLAQFGRMKKKAKENCVRRFSIGFARDALYFFRIPDPQYLFIIRQLRSDVQCHKMKSTHKTKKNGSNFRVEKEKEHNRQLSSMSNYSHLEGNKWISTSAKDLITDCDSFFTITNIKIVIRKKSVHSHKISFPSFFYFHFLFCQRVQASNTMVSLDLI